MVLIPEWLADGTLNLGQAKGPASLPMLSRAWRTLPELRLAAMTLAELRQAASELRMYQYGSATRDQLTTRLLRRNTIAWRVFNHFLTKGMRLLLLLQPEAGARKFSEE